MDTYLLIIGISGVIIISFLFNILAKRTNIPSVLMLIILGVIIQFFIPEKYNVKELADLGTLEIIGNVGLVMIVLEAALDLKLEAEKRKLILQSFLVALLGLVVSSLAIAGLIWLVIPAAESYFTALLYAVPLSIMSSAIIIPSVGGLRGAKKEFMVYESTFSDILGIMFFQFLLASFEHEGASDIAINIGLNIVVTIVASIVLSYLLVFIFQRLTSQVKLFLVISLLMLVFALGKKLHLSSLLIILAFGLVLNNTKLFFKGKFLKPLTDEEKLKPIMHDFHVLTLESAFVIRTFFFVIFGMFITLDGLFTINVAIVSVGILALLYGIRYIFLKTVVGEDIKPQLYIAPRGLITVLLFFVLESHPEVRMEEGGFDIGILLFVVLISSLIMTIGLIVYRGQKVSDVLFSQLPSNKVDEDGDGVNDNFEDEVNENVENQDFNQF